LYENSIVQVRRKLPEKIQNKRATDLFFIVALVKILYPRDDTSLSINLYLKVIVKT
jgi:hypothetical protein